MGKTSLVLSNIMIYGAECNMFTSLVQRIQVDLPMIKILGLVRNTCCCEGHMNREKQEVGKN